MLVVIIIAVSVGAVVYLLQRGGGRKRKDVLDSRPEPEKIEPPVIHSSFKNDETDAKPKENHEGVTIYRDREERQIWVCPNCEAENPPGKEKCCVCGRRENR